MERQYVNNIIIEDCQLKYRNLAGEIDDYNRTGKRTFSVKITDPEFAETLKNDGWNVKPVKKPDEEEPTEWHLPVEAKYRKADGSIVKNPPRIYLIAGKTKTELTEDDIKLVDCAEIKKVDITIRPYIWENRGKTGVKALVKNMYITVVVDALEQKYSDLDDDNEEEPF